jgi:uncharacterized protein with HEPN domain
MWKDEATAADILLAAQDIQRFTERMSYSDFIGLVAEENQRP